MGQIQQNKTQKGYSTRRRIYITSIKYSDYIVITAAAAAAACVYRGRRAVYCGDLRLFHIPRQSLGQWTVGGTAELMCQRGGRKKKQVLLIKSSTSLYFKGRQDSCCSMFSVGGHTAKRDGEGEETFIYSAFEKEKRRKEKKKRAWGREREREREVTDASAVERLYGRQW